MSFWDVSFFNYFEPDLNEEPPVKYSYGTIDLNVEPNADIGFEIQSSYGFVYDDSKQSNPEEGYEEKSAASIVNWETKEVDGTTRQAFRMQTGRNSKVEENIAKHCKASSPTTELYDYNYNRLYERLINDNKKNKKISLSDIDIFWTKLNTANPTLLEEEEEEIDVIKQMSLVTEEINSKPYEIKKKSLIKKVLAQVFPNKSDKKAPSVQKDTRGCPTLKAHKQKEQDVVKDNLASQESTFEPSRHSSFTAVTEKVRNPYFGVVVPHRYQKQCHHRTR
ncbi:hypothetical protein R6Q57_004252 [Mikania cordata]